MSKIQALIVARKVLADLRATKFHDFKDEQEFERKWGVSHAQVVNALPIIEAMEIVEAASYG